MNYLLLWHLNRFKWFELPGIGLFEAKEEKAFIDHSSGKIFPSSLSTIYKSITAEKAELMLQNLHEETGYSTDELEKELAATCLKINDNLKLKQEFDFLPFGKFTYDKHQINFEASDQNLHDQFFGLTSVPLVPLKSEYKIVEDSKPLPIRPVPSRNKINEYSWLLPLLAFLITIFLVLKYCTSKPTNSKSQPEIVNNNSIEQPINKNPIEVADTTKTIKQSALDTLVNETMVNHANSDSLSQVLKHQKCALITGSFKKSYWRNYMIHQLEKEGYVIYTEKFEGFTRVGIKIDCLDKNINEILDVLKKKYDQQTWILKY